MNEKNRQQNDGAGTENEQGKPEGAMNPFENRQPADKDIEQRNREVENEQQFKEAQTERD